MIRIACMALALIFSKGMAMAQTPPTISVNGSATIEITPDMAVMTVAVNTKHASPAGALDANSAAAAKIIAFAKSKGIASKDIATRSVSVTQAYKNGRDKDGNPVQLPDGYAASNSVDLRIRDLAATGAIAREVLDHGANHIESLRFLLEDRSKAQDEALKLALADARRKATLLAETSNARLGSILHIVSPPKAGGGMERAAFGGRYKAAAMNAPVEAGVLEITAEVEAAWSLQAQ